MALIDSRLEVTPEEVMKKSKGCRCPWCGGRTRRLYTLISGEGDISGMSHRECTIKSCMRRFFA